MIRVKSLAYVSLAAGIAACGLLGPEPDASGTYTFSNRYGFVEEIVVRPGYAESLEFSVAGQVTLTQADGQLTGHGSCTRTATISERPSGDRSVTETPGLVEVSGFIKGRSITEFRMTGCAFPKPMWGRLESGRIILDTDLGFPVSRGTTVISDRFGDPSTLRLSRSDS